MKQHQCCSAVQPNDDDQFWNHEPGCPMIADADVDARHKRDMSPEWFHASYVERGASAIRARVVRANAATQAITGAIDKTGTNSQSLTNGHYSTFIKPDDYNWHTPIGD